MNYARLVVPFVALASLVLVSSAVAEAPPSSVNITKVWIALAADGGVASDRELRVLSGTRVTAHVVVEATVDGRKRVFSDASALRKGRRKVSRVSRWPAALGNPRIALYKLEADPLSGGVYDNTGTMEHNWHPTERADHPHKWHWCPIDYVQTDTKQGSRWSYVIDAVPTTTRNFNGLGTMRFAAKVSHLGQNVASVGLEHKDKAGLRPGIALIRVRRDNTSVGYMTELMNVPYVYGSSSASGRDKDHQSERAVGADCADLIVYGWRRSGRKMGYTWSQGLKSHTRRQVDVASLRGGRYRNADGDAIKFGRDVNKGDILLWRRHVAVISDVDPTGFLTPDTPILHTVQEVPALIPLRRIGFGFDTPPFQIRRPHWM